jgi:hypothetical protein
MKLVNEMGRRYKWGKAIGLKGGGNSFNLPMLFERDADVEYCDIRDNVAECLTEEY